VPGAKVVTQFSLAGGGTNAWGLQLPGEPKVRYSPSDGILELFLLDGKRTLQLTSFGYPDTGVDATLGSHRAFFIASADPLGTNRMGMCQIFSIGRFADGLRQLTRFPDDGRTRGGCGILPTQPQACRVNAIVQEPSTEAIEFVTSCDPLGRNPNGEQIFSM